MIWARLDGPDTGALLPEVLVVVCSRVPRAEAWDRFVVLWLLHWLERTTLIGCKQHYCPLIDRPSISMKTRVSFLFDKF